MLEILIWILCCLICGKFAEYRGRSGVTWFLLSMIISPIFVFLLLLILRDKSWKGYIE